MRYEADGKAILKCKACDKTYHISRRCLRWAEVGGVVINLSEVQSVCPHCGEHHSATAEQVMEAFSGPNPHRAHKAATNE